MADTRIKINVGGTVFETTRSTIDKLGSGYFNRLFDTCSGFKQPEDSVYFIDRDPECFRVILNIARYGDMHLFSTHPNLEMLIKEADFYLLGSSAMTCILRYKMEQMDKKETEITVLRSILSVSQESLRELQKIKNDTLELVRGMASQAYWTS